MTINQLRDFISLKEKMGTDVTDFKIHLNLKMAIPFASLVFALLGAPLGITRRRASSSIGLGLSIIVIFVYYILTFISMSFGELKILSPVLAAWLPNFLTAGIGWYFLARAAVQ
jgi:lipopolysaccharide export system permease protein